MRRLLCVILSCAMVLALLTGCGGEGGGTSTSAL